MRVKWVFAGLGAVAAVLVLGAAAFYLSLAGPIGWEPPEVAPLPSGPPFEADEIVLLDDGYVVAGVAGTSEPGLDDRCSGRFALVELADDGSARRAVVASGLERYRSCAHRVEALFPDDAGGWLLSGSGARRAKPSSIFPGPGTDHPWFTLRFSGDGEPDEDFGDGGVARDALVVGRAEGALVTYLRHRVTDEGDVRGDLLVEPDRVTVGWSTIVAGERFFVAIESGPALTFQTFVVDGAEDPVRFRALDPRPYDARPRPTVDLGSAVLNAGDLALHDGVLYVVIDGRSPRVFAVDPHERQLVASFGRGGSVSLPVRELVTSAGVAVDGRGRPLVVFTTLDHVHGTRLHARRYSPDGALDPTFGGLVKELGKGSDLDVARVLVDRSGHVLVFAALDSVLIRLTRAGRLDPSFGDDGAVSLGAADVCELAPASGSEACG